MYLNDQYVANIVTTDHQKVCLLCMKTPLCVTRYLKRTGRAVSPPLPVGDGLMLYYIQQLIRCMFHLWCRIVSIHGSKSI